MLAGASVVYGQTAVDAFFISKEAMSPSGRPNTFSSGYKLLVSTPWAKTSTSTTSLANGLAVTTNEADNPFGLGIRLNGLPR